MLDLRIDFTFYGVIYIYIYIYVTLPLLVVKGIYIIILLREGAYVHVQSSERTNRPNRETLPCTRNQGFLKKIVGRMHYMDIKR